MQKLAEICVRRPVFATMLIAAMVVVGGVSYFSLGVDLYPNIDMPAVTVTTVSPGASAQEIEADITDAVESAISTIGGVSQLQSTSVEGVSIVVVLFALEKNAELAAQEVRDKVSRITDLPEGARAPVVEKIDVGAAPILQIALSGDELHEVSNVAEAVVKRQIQHINGVGQVQILGGVDDLVRVSLDLDRLRAFNLTVAEVAGALQMQNVEAPGGRLTEGNSELAVRTMGRLRSIDQLRDVAIARRGAYDVRLRDVADVTMGTAEQRTVSRLNGQQAVTLLVTKQSGQNTVAIADAVKEALADIQDLPAGMQMEVVADQSVFIEASVDTIKEHLIIGGLFAAIVVFVFLRNLRSTFIAALAIPTSIIATFALMAVIGYTLNQITMLALALMVGIVIDDAIVVLENIYRYVEEKGMSPFEAAIAGTKDISLAVLATTLSLLAVFLPVSFMQGIVGRFMSSFGLTAAFAIFVSMIVSFTLTPMLAARLIKAPAPVRPDADGRATAEHGASKDSRIYRAVEHAYMRMLDWSLAHRWVIVVVSVLVVMSTVPLFMVVGKNFSPEDDQSEFNINLATREGTTLAVTESLAERIATDLRALPGVSATLTTVGGGAQQQVNQASVFVKLVPLGERAQSQQELMVPARAILAKYPEALSANVEAVQAISGGGGRNAAIQYIIRGPNLDQLGLYADQLLEKVRTIPDVLDPDSTRPAGKLEVRVVIDRARAADLGVHSADISQSLGMLIAGQQVGTITIDDDALPVRLEAAERFRSGTSGLANLSVSSTKLGSVSLDSVARIEQGIGPASVARESRQRQITVMADIKPGGSQAAVLAQIDQFAAQMALPDGYTASAAGLSKELQQAGLYFVLALLLSFVFMYMVLAAQFESFVQPIIILLTLPLAVPMGVLSLLVMGQTVNIFSGLGLLLLFGIVKKNAILQMDHTNALRASGVPRHEAIRRSNKDRLRPILMTTLALVAGMLPLVVSSGVGAGTNRSIGVLVVGGQTLCLVLTLLAVPVFYSITEDISESRAGLTTRAGTRFLAMAAGVRRRLGVAR
jgi:HAE1 family hydrophobic/amphiphilic exporter-1